MRARPKRRRSRSVSRTGAVLVVLLAALVHLLACAHGPTAVGASGADAILAAAPAASGQVSRPADDRVGQQTTPAQGNQSHCWGIDEPTVQPPRDLTPATDAVPNALPRERTAAPSDAVRPAAPFRRGPGAGPAGQSRARLGVWRT
ncbi:hypothetical protein ABZ313_24080 [Streptomyces sp. NPDC006251]|uniref:hypothetical protein n=1 Tax=Streptomyces sp. NPDC006251 TaxID=3155718 RepID=UPI0033A9443A